MPKRGLSEHRNRDPLRRIVGISATAVMRDPLRIRNVIRMPCEQSAVIHFVAEYATSVSVRSARRIRAEEVQDEKPPRPSQHAIGFARDPEEVFAVAQIETESEHDDIERAGVERQLICGPLPRIDASQASS
jgi:hypothetical protein